MTSHLLTNHYLRSFLYYLGCGIIMLYIIANASGCSGNVKSDFDFKTSARAGYWGYKVDSGSFNGSATKYFTYQWSFIDTTHPTPKPIIYHHYELSGSDTQFLSLKQIINLSDDLSNKQKNYFLNWINTSLKIDSTKK